MSTRFTLPPLPFARDALAPAISADTFTEHHDGHHQAYVDKLNELAEAAGMADEDLVAIIRQTGGSSLFNQAAQHFNHAFFWKSLSPDGGAPTGRLAARIEKDFGSVEALGEKLVEVGAAHFASGWVWLVEKGGRLEVIDTHDAGTPVESEGVLPLLTIDVWEHAYYLDHQKDRKAFLEAVVAEHLNWAFAGETFEAGELDTAALGIGNGALRKAA
jgi:Fe-Mn family superoxide dismutase